MTRKDYRAMADILLANNSPKPIVKAMADMYARDNPRFNRVLFYRASGVSES